MQDGDVVEINYVGRIKNTGEIFDLTDREVAEEENIDTTDMDLGPVKVLLGQGYVLEGLEDEIKKMEVGDEQTVTVPKDSAFGSRKSEQIKTISRKEFEKYDVQPHRGMPVEVDGRRGKILTVSSGRVKVDFNHPLAGKDLEYDVEVLRQVDDREEQVDAVIEFHVSLDYDFKVDDGTVSVTLHDDVPGELRERLAEEIEKLDGVDEAVVEADGSDDA